MRFSILKNDKKKRRKKLERDEIKKTIHNLFFSRAAAKAMEMEAWKYGRKVPLLM